TWPRPTKVGGKRRAALPPPAVHAVVAASVSPRSRWRKGAPVKSVDEHLTDILATVRPLQPLDLQLMEARGCLIARDVVSPVSLPPFDNAAMDGYAVHAEDLVEASEDSPVTLPVIGDIAAGSADIITVRPGMCAWIMTGAPVPPARC